jgi:hypothetical protein
MAGGILRTHVHVIDDQGRPHVFAPGVEVPDWAAEKITNPKAWAEAPKTGAEPGGNGGGRSGGEPPRSGRGSSREAWAAYSAQRGVEAPDSATREEIIAELEERGIIEPAE